ncbi:50S ribosomal protein L10 [Candidatus Parcubacteria bacterium]|nr:50S ribosomal protein L10 [Patescibacteria group bacterium]MCG2697821.1 50S ribosomal protein L10 [Candidatus Parcubacteria bacterium]
MAKTKEQKKKIIDDLKEKISRAKSIVFVAFNNLNVNKNEELRRQLREGGGEYYAAKKTLMDLALKDSALENVGIKEFDGQAAAVFGYGDEVSPAKIVAKFKKDNEGKLEFIGGILENKFISSESVAALAQIPSRQELYAKVVGSINAPVFGFVNALAGNLRNFVYVLKAIEEKK